MTTVQAMTPTAAPVNLGGAPSMSGALEDLVNKLIQVKHRLRLVSQIALGGDKDVKLIQVDPMALFSVLDESADDCEAVISEIDELTTRAIAERHQVEGLQAQVEGLQGLIRQFAAPDASKPKRRKA